MQRYARAIVVFVCLSVLSGIDVYAAGVIPGRSQSKTISQSPTTANLNPSWLSSGDAVYKNGKKVGEVSKVEYNPANGYKWLTFRDNTTGKVITCTLYGASALGFSIRDVSAQSGKPAQTVPAKSPAQTDRPGWPVRRTTSELSIPVGRVGVPLTDQQAATFRDGILNKYGFTSTAASYIRSNAKITVTNKNPSVGPGSGGGGWKPKNKWWGEGGTLELQSTQHEAAVHEFAHVWYDKLLADNPNFGNELVAATKQLADLDPSKNPQFAAAIKEARSYVAMGRAATDTSRGTDPYTFLKQTEIYASFASFTMGNFKSGSHQLPQFMWKFYSSLFK